MDYLIKLKDGFNASLIHALYTIPKVTSNKKSFNCTQDFFPLIIYLLFSKGEKRKKRVTRVYELKNKITSRQNDVFRENKKIHIYIKK